MACSSQPGNSNWLIFSLSRSTRIRHLTFDVNPDMPHGHLQALARLWRVAHFVLSDFLNLSLQQSAETSSPLLGLTMAPAESLMVENPSRPTARSGQRPAPRQSAGKSGDDKDEAAIMASSDAQPRENGATPE